MKTSRNEVDNEHQVEMEQLSSPLEDNMLVKPTHSKNIYSIFLLLFSAEDYQKQIEELHQNLSEKDEQRTLLQERLNKVELELKRTSDDYFSIIAEYESLLKERDALVNQQSIQSTER